MGCWMSLQDADKDKMIPSDSGASANAVCLQGQRRCGQLGPQLQEFAPHC